jgi:hypothetical protein
LGARSGLLKSGEKVVTKSARSDTSLSEKPGQAGIDVYGMPRRMTLTRSSCVGSAPFGVVRILNLPVVKLRGRGRSAGRRSLRRPPFSPWHCEQYFM